MELALDLDFSRKRHVASNHNRKRDRVYIEEARKELHHQAQIRSKDKEKMTALGGILAESRESGRKSAGHLIHSNTTLATFSSENTVRTNFCLPTHTYYLHPHSLNPQRSSLNTTLLLK